MARTSWFHRFGYGVGQVCSTASGTTAYLDTRSPFMLVWHFSSFCWASLQVRDIPSKPPAHPITSEDRPSLLLRAAGPTEVRLSAGSISTGAVGQVSRLRQGSAMRSTSARWTTSEKFDGHGNVKWLIGRRLVLKVRGDSDVCCFFVCGNANEL